MEKLLLVLLIYTTLNGYGQCSVLDNSFDTDGLQTTDFGNGSRANGVITQPDGKIVAVGEGNNGQVDISLKLTTLFYCKLTTPNRLPFSGSFSG